MERLDGSLRRALRGAGVPDAGVLTEVTRAWPGAVGPAIARAAWPQRIARDGSLHVTTLSSTWAFELGRMGEELREALRAVLGSSVPPALRFAPGPVPSVGAEERAPHELPPPTPAEKSAARFLASLIDDAGLREAVQDAIAASLAAARSGRPV